MTTYQFQNCVVHYWPERNYLRTLFPDGKECPAQFGFSNESAARSIALGYDDGGDCDAIMTRMHREHELSHTFLAEKRGFHHSPTLWSVAHKEPYLQAWEEEAIVLGWQWFLNTGELTGAAEILRAHRTFDVDEIAREFKQRFR